jgi:hypothetical protein
MVESVTSSAQKIDEFLTLLYQTPGGKPTSTIQRLRLFLCQPLTTTAAIRYLVNLPVGKITIPENEWLRATWLFDRRRPGDPRNFISSYINPPRLFSSAGKATHDTTSERRRIEHSALASKFDSSAYRKLVR